MQDVTLKGLRNARDYSQGGLALLMGVSRRAIERWENGETYRMPAGYIARLARALSVSPMTILEAIGETHALTALRVHAGTPPS